jgi:hypothetical protein
VRFASHKRVGAGSLLHTMWAEIMLISNAKSVSLVHEYSPTRMRVPLSIVPGSESGDGD